MTRSELPIVLVCLILVGGQMTLGQSACTNTGPAGLRAAGAAGAGAGSGAGADVGADAGVGAGAGVPTVAALLEPIRAKYDLPALGGLVISSHGPLAIGVTGVRKRGDATLATIDDVWHLGSDTKAMTAAIVARLVDRGVLGFDDTLAKLFPDQADTMDPAYRGVTLRLLLSHRSGMGEVTDYPALVEALSASTDPVEVVRALWTRGVLALPPLSPPDTSFVYSSSGYVVVGAALERATGKAWETIINEEIFAPLGMKSCGFGAPGDAAAHPVDQPWGHDGLTPVAPGPDADNPPALGPAGTVHCSLGDWGNFVAVFLGAHPDYLTPPSLSALTSPEPGADYALGWSVVSRPWAGGIAFDHQGSNTFWYADVWVAPARDRAFMTVTNRGDAAVAFPAVDTAVAALVGAYLSPQSP